MIDTKTESQTRPDSTIAIGFYAVSGFVFVASVAATIHFIRSMSGSMEMAGGWKMSMVWMRMPGQSSLASFEMFALMWLAMMVAMMLPSALPMLSKFRRPVPTTIDSFAGFTTVLVASGYFAVWMGIGTIVYFAGVILADSIMRWSGLSHAMRILSGAALVLAGAFQFSNWKTIGLNHCRDPLACLTSENRVDLGAALSHGLHQGLYCAICCSGLMLALLALGAMNPFVMFAIAVIIALEKLLPNPQPIVRLSGVVAIIGGILIALQ